MPILEVNSEATSVKLHDVIKIQYSNMGYLPGIPYYLISDYEMMEAFLKEDGFFNEYYPCPCEDLRGPYEELKWVINISLATSIGDGGLTKIPDWVYSYMLMVPTTYQSPEADIADLYELLNMDSASALCEFDEDVAHACYEVSSRWIDKIQHKIDWRPPTMFGEAHVIKSLRLDKANVFLEDRYKSGV